MRGGTRPIVISIAAVSGGGKTTITKQLKERLNKISYSPSTITILMDRKI